MRSWHPGNERLRGTVMNVQMTTMSPLRNHLLRELTPAELAAIKPHLKEFSPRQGTVLQEAGRSIEAVFFPETALVLLWSVLANGSAVGCAMIGRDGAVG